MKGMTSSVDLSVVIVSWNTRELVRQCLHSLEETLSSSLSVEVFVVDNCSSDDSVEIIAREFPWVDLISSSTNLGFAGGNNQALVLCHGRYVLLLNPDTVVKPGALEILVRFMDEHADAGAASSMLLNPDGTLQHSCYPAPTLRRELWRLLHLDWLYPYGSYPMPKWDRDTSRQIDIAQGACLIIRHQVLDQVGLFDEKYFMYSEEMDLCLRILQARWNIYWVPSAEVIHYGGQSTEQVATVMFVQLFRSKVIFFRKHYGERRAQAYKMILLITSLVRLAFSPLILLEHPSKRRLHRDLVNRYRKLILALPSL